MRVVVTGGSGNLGRFVVEALVDNSGGRTPNDVVVLDRVRGPAHPQVQYLLGDVEDSSARSSAWWPAPTS